MGVELEIYRDMVFDGALNGVDSLTGTYSRPIPNAENMGVHGLRRVTPPHIQHHIGGLAADTRQAFQGTSPS